MPKTATCRISVSLNITFTALQIPKSLDTIIFKGSGPNYELKNVFSDSLSQNMLKPVYVIK